MEKMALKARAKNGLPMQRIIEAHEKDGLIEAHRFFIVQFTRVCSCVETCMLCLDNITA